MKRTTNTKTSTEQFNPSPQAEDYPPRKPRRGEDWERAHAKQFRKNIFTPRLCRDLNELNPPTDFIECDIHKGEGLFLYGNTGAGKTVYAAFMLEHLAKQMWMNYINNSTGFVSLPQLFKRLKKSYSDTEKNEWNILEEYTDTWLLVLDDLGVGGKPSDWMIENLYHVLNERYERMAPTIITSNLSLPKLSELYGDHRITSRIERMSRVYKKGHWNKEQ
jgi:DNA replication protein DnaC